MLFVRGLSFDHRDIPIVRCRHDVFFETSSEGEDVAEIHCAGFRHGWTWEWDGIGHLDGTSDAFTVTVTLTASNMRGKRIQTFTLPTISTTARAMTLIDPVERSYKASFPLQEPFERAVREHDKDWLKFPERDDD